MTEAVCRYPSNAPTSERRRLVIADDHEPTRVLLRTLIELEGMQVVGEASVSQREARPSPASGDVHDPTVAPLPQFRCFGCGYGASCRVSPVRCPMCGGARWEITSRRTLTSWIADLDHRLGRETRA